MAADVRTSLCITSHVQLKVRLAVVRPAKGVVVRAYRRAIADLRRVSPRCMRRLSPTARPPPNLTAPRKALPSSRTAEQGCVYTSHRSSRYFAALARCCSALGAYMSRSTRESLGAATPFSAVPHSIRAEERHRAFPRSKRRTRHRGARGDHSTRSRPSLLGPPFVAPSSSPGDKGR